MLRVYLIHTLIITIPRSAEKIFLKADLETRGTTGPPSTGCLGVTVVHRGVF